LCQALRLRDRGLPFRRRLQIRGDARGAQAARQPEGQGGQAAMMENPCGHGRARSSKLNPSVRNELRFDALALQLAVSTRL
jgi:hypothetical protein